MRTRCNLAAAALMALTGCAVQPVSSPSPAPTPSPITATPMPQSPPQPFDAATANNAFAFKLLAHVWGAGSPRNTVVSPLSVASALAMTTNGAQGATAEAMAKALGASGVALAQLNDAHAALAAQLRGPGGGTRLDIANSLWARQGVTFKPDFLERVRAAYDAQSTSLDFGAPGSAKAINDWVSGKTSGKITDLIESIPPEAVLYLVNAIYFKGAWSVPFDKARTADKPFTSDSGQTKQVPMMQRAGRMPYVKGDGFQAVALPYADNRLQMLIVLPDRDSSLKAFQAVLTPDNWDRWTRALQQTEGELALPRFKVEYGATLNEALKVLGMGIAFDPGRADFRGMADAPLFISEVKHKAFIDVNETGTEAAAATSVGVSVTSIREANPAFSMVVDRPFFFAIRDTRTQAILFAGTVNQP